MQNAERLPYPDRRSAFSMQALVPWRDDLVLGVVVVPHLDEFFARHADGSRLSTSPWNVPLLLNPSEKVGSGLKEMVRLPSRSMQGMNLPSPTTLTAQ